MKINTLRFFADGIYLYQNQDSTLLDKIIFSDKLLQKFCDILEPTNEKSLDIFAAGNYIVNIERCLVDNHVRIVLYEKDSDKIVCNTNISADKAGSLLSFYNPKKTYIEI